MTRIDVDEWADTHGEPRMTPTQFRLEQSRAEQEEELFGNFEVIDREEGTFITEESPITLVPRKDIDSVIDETLDRLIDEGYIDDSDLDPDDRDSYSNDDRRYDEADD